MKQKGFIQIIVIILVVLVLVAVGAYYFGTKNRSSVTPMASAQPSSIPMVTADPNTSWKTYTDPVYGFSFKYPENQDGKANPPKTVCPKPLDGDITRCILSVVESCSNSDCTDSINVQVYLNPKDVTYESSLADFTGSLASTKIVDSSIGGLQAKMRIYQDPQPSMAQIYYVTGSKYSYILYGGPNDVISNQILSTFKFTK